MKEEVHVWCHYVKVVFFWFVGRSMGFIFVAQDRTMYFAWIIDSTFHNVLYNSIITHCKYLLINQKSELVIVV